MHPGRPRILSFLLLARAVKTLPVGTAYAVWTGIGVAGTALLGMFLFGESRDPWRLLSILLILAGMGGADAPAKRLKTDVVDCHSGGRGSIFPRRRDGRAAEGGGLENR